MNQKTKINRIYLPFLIAVLIASVAFRTAALLTDFDEATGYFGDKGLIIAASVIVVAGAVLLTTYSIAAGGKRKLVATFATPATYVPTGAVCSALMFFAIKTAGSLKELYMAFAGGYLKFSLSTLPSYIAALLVPLAILSIGYFILNACVFERGSEARAVFGIINVAFLALYASYLYFDTTLTINAPNKIIDQMAFIFAALFFLYEIRISLGRECWNLYMTFGFLASLLTGYSSLPSVIAYFANNTEVSHSVYESLLTLSLFIFITSRLILAASLRKDEESENVTLMKDSARERLSVIDERAEAKKLAELELYEKLNKIADDPLSFEENSDAVQISYDELLAPDDAAESSAEFEIPITEPTEEHEEIPQIEEPEQEQIQFFEESETPADTDDIQ